MGALSHCLRRLLKSVTAISLIFVADQMVRQSSVCVLALVLPSFVVQVAAWNCPDGYGGPDQCDGGKCNGDSPVVGSDSFAGECTDFSQCNLVAMAGGGNIWLPHPDCCSCWPFLASNAAPAPEHPDPDSSYASPGSGNSEWTLGAPAAVASALRGGLRSGSGYYCGGTWNGNNNDGSNYEGPLANTGIDQCKSMCSGSGGGCVGWTVTNNNECYLKTSVGDMRSDSGVQGSGYCYPSCGDEQPHQNNDGHNYDGPIQVQNREFCKAKCQAARGQCKGWTVTNDGECYLKDSVGSMRSDSGVQASGYC